MMSYLTLFGIAMGTFGIMLLLIALINKPKRSTEFKKVLVTYSVTVVVAGAMLILLSEYMLCGTCRFSHW